MPAPEKVKLLVGGERESRTIEANPLVCVEGE